VAASPDDRGGLMVLKIVGVILLAVFVLAVLRRLPQILLLLFVLCLSASCAGH
jgi:hypothetical protein